MKYLAQLLILKKHLRKNITNLRYFYLNLQTDYLHLHLIITSALEKLCQKLIEQIRKLRHSEIMTCSKPNS